MGYTHKTNLKLSRCVSRVCPCPGLVLNLEEPGRVVQVEARIFWGNLVFLQRKPIYDNININICIYIYYNYTYLCLCKYGCTLFGHDVYCLTPNSYLDAQHGASTTILAPSWKTRWWLFPFGRRVLQGFDIRTDFKTSIWVSCLVGVTLPNKPYLSLVNYYKLLRSMYVLLWSDISIDVFTVHTIHHIYQHILYWSILYFRCFPNCLRAFLLSIFICILTLYNLI